MANGVTTVWEVRPTNGVDTNGAGFDSAIASAGTDYSQQDAAQLTLTDIINVVATVTVTSVTGGFTAAMIGNKLRISATATGFLVGYYTIITVPDTNTCTLDVTCSGGAGGTGGACKVGGAAKTLTLQTTSALANSANGGAVGGNKIWVKNEAWNAAETAFGGASVLSPTIIEGYNTARGDAPTPANSANMPRNNKAGVGVPFTLGTNGGWIFRYIWASNSASIGFSQTTNGNIFEFCKSSNNATTGWTATSGKPHLRGCEATANTTIGVSITGAGTLVMEGCVSHGNTTAGVSLAAGASATLVNNLIYANASHGILALAATGTIVIIGNTIDGNTGAAIDGINVDLDDESTVFLLNNQITNNGRDGVRGADAITNSQAHVVSNNNNFFGNVGVPRTNWPVGSADTALDPGYVNAATGNYAIGTATKALGYPGVLEGSASTSYTDMGAVQRVEGAAGGGPIMTGYIVSGG